MTTFHIAHQCQSVEDGTYIVKVARRALPSPPWRSMSPWASPQPEQGGLHRRTRRRPATPCKGAIASAVASNCHAAGEGGPQTTWLRPKMTSKTQICRWWSTGDAACAMDLRHPAVRWGGKMVYCTSAHLVVENWTRVLDPVAKHCLRHQIVELTSPQQLPTPTSPSCEGWMKAPSPPSLSVPQVVFVVDSSGDSG
jgi:hypothetical protein